MGNYNLSKSQYLTGLRCDKLLWVSRHQPDKLPALSLSAQFLMEQGNEVGEAARQCFPNGVNLYGKPVAATAKATAAADRRPLFEASFAYTHCQCRVDILAPNGDGWDIIEVKATTEVDDSHISDLAFQRHCCEGAGLKVRRCCLMHLSKDYRRDGTIDLSQLFVTEDVSALVEREYLVPALQSRLMRSMLSRSCPEIILNPACVSPDRCPLIDLCWADLPEENCLTLYRGKQMGFDLIDADISSLRDIPDGIKLTPKQQIQRRCAISGEPHVDRQALRRFLGRLRFPLYLLDFETWQSAIPMYDGMRPYQQIPFQFSLHVLARLDGEPEHHSYIASENGDPRHGFMDQLRQVIGDNGGSVVVYNEAFEKTILYELATYLPEHRAWVSGVTARFVDLLTPFREFWFHHPKQHGSASIKKVLPAMTGKDYGHLAIQDGSAASVRYARLVQGRVGDAERRRTLRDLETYCGQDTEAMLWILRELETLAGA